MPRLAVHTIEDQLLRKLLTIPPLSNRADGPERRACRAFMRDGRVIDHVIFMEDVISQYLGSAAFPYFIDVAEVTNVDSSPDVTPPEALQRLYQCPQLAMSYLHFKLAFRDGRVLRCSSGPGVEFLGLPDGFLARDIADVIPLDRDQYAPGAHNADVVRMTCLYDLPVSA